MIEARPLLPGDARYPALLAVVQDAPPLWVAGRDPDPLAPAVAIVGARNPAPYGLEVAHALASDLATLGFCIVSGLARGIDAAAHDGALARGGRTIAVLGSGVDRPYPIGNLGLYRRILRNGTIVSQFPPGTAARAFHFPKRNRVIAGLSLGVILVQSRIDGGGMSTLAAAIELNRETFAVPGDVRSELSAGPHHALRESQAHVCANADDVRRVLEPELSWGSPSGEAPAAPGRLDPDEGSVMRALTTEPARAETVAVRAGLDLAAATRALARLELDGVVARGAGATYRRLR